jgi:hypothetical protein
VHSIIKFFVAFIAKEQGLFERVGEGTYRAKVADDISDLELEESALDEGDAVVGEFEGWVYAFSFPTLVRDDGPFPIKVGKTLGDVNERVAQQVRGSAAFEQPVVLGRWQVNRVGPFELAIHNVLKVWGRWREQAPGTEWFDTTLSEVESVIKFVERTAP